MGLIRAALDLLHLLQTQGKYIYIFGVCQLGFLYIYIYVFLFLQKGGWALAQTENPPKFSALEMLENSLYSPTWEGSCLA